MNSELQAIKDAWEATPRQDLVARSLADTYVSSHPEEFTGYAEMEIEQLTGAIDAFREAGMAEEVQKVETWLLHRFEPQNIGGVYRPQIRITSGE